MVFARDEFEKLVNEAKCDDCTPNLLSATRAWKDTSKTTPAVTMLGAAADPKTKYFYPQISIKKPILKITITVSTSPLISFS